MVFTQLQVVGWGWDIAAFLWLAGMSGMAAAIYAALVHGGLMSDARRKAYSWALFVGIAAALVLVVSDLSRPYNLMNAMLLSLEQGTFGIGRSWMAIGIVLLAIMALMSLALLVSSYAGGILSPLRGRAYSYAMLAVGILVTMYSGFLLAAAPGQPFWNTPLLPLLWLASGTTAAMGLSEIMLYRTGEDRELSTRISLYGAFAELVELLTLSAYMYMSYAAMGVGAHIAAEQMLFGPLSYITWIGVVALGIVGPMISEFVFAKYRYSGYALLAVAVLVIAGALLLRYTVLASSAFEPIGLL